MSLTTRRPTGTRVWCRRAAVLFVVVALIAPSLSAIRLSGATQTVPPEPGYKPNPLSWLVSGTLLKAEQSVYSKEVAKGQTTVGTAGVSVSWQFESAGAGQVTVTSTRTILNSSNPNYQQYLGKPQTAQSTGSTSDVNASMNAFEDSDFFPDELGVVTPDEVDPGLGGEAGLLYIGAIPMAGTRTYSAADLGYGSDTTGSEQITVSLHQPYVHPQAGKLDTAVITFGADLSYTDSGYACSTSNGTFSISFTGHASGGLIVEMNTGLVMKIYITATDIKSSSCPDYNDRVDYSLTTAMTTFIIGQSNVLAVYPTQPTFTQITLNYQGKQLTSPIKLTLVKDKSFPKGLTVTFRPQGAKAFTDSPSVPLSSSGISTVDVNMTLDCAAAKCGQAGGTQLPAAYTVTISAAGGSSYNVNETIPVQLLKAKWLVMLYSAADTTPNLEAGMFGNIYEMIDVSKPTNNPAVGMIVLSELLLSHQVHMTAPTSSSPLVVVSGDTPRLYRIANGTMTQVGKDWTAKNMSSPSTLTAFVQQAEALIPSDHTQLILSDHGGGVVGLVWDEHDGDKPTRIPQLAGVLKGLPKLDILSFDACLMAQTEVLYQLRDYASYITASEIPVPGPGYDYTSFVGSLLANPDQKTTDYLKTIVNSFGDKYDSTKSGGSARNATLAAIDPTKLGAVVTGLDTLAGLLNQHYRAHDEAFNGTMILQVATAWGTGHIANMYPYIDVRSLAQNILRDSDITDQKVRDAASSLIAATKAAVIANATDIYLSKTDGIYAGAKKVAALYEGLTVLMWKTPNVPKDDYSSFTTLESKLSFVSSASNWSTFMTSFNRSATASSVGWILLKLVHFGQTLTLNVYDSSGGHTGVNPSLVNYSKTATELTPGSYYLDLRNGTAFIAIPATTQSFRTVVDGSNMLEGSEPYTVSYSVVQNGRVVSTQKLQGTIAQATLQSAPVTLQGANLTIGQVTVTASGSTTGPVTTGSHNTQANQTNVTTQPSPGPGPLPPSVYWIAGVAIVAFLAVAAFIAFRIRGHGQRQKAPLAAPAYPTYAPSPPRYPAQPPYQPQVIRQTRYCPNCGAEAAPGASFCLNCGTRLA